MTSAPAYAAVFAISLTACGGAQPPPKPTVGGDLPCLLPDEDNFIRGLYVDKGANGEPVIRLAQFRRVDDNVSGSLDFDLAALTKMGGELAGNAEAREYAMHMQSSGMADKIHVTNIGIYKLVGVINQSIDYADLVEAQWRCDDVKGLYGSHRRSHGDEYDEVSPGMNASIGECKAGKQHVEMVDHTDYARQRLDDVRANRAKALAFCDPSGHLGDAWTTPGYGNPMLTMLSPSTNPLYPAGSFYTEWYPTHPEEGETDKPAFQIFWLITKQKFKTTGKW